MKNTISFLTAALLSILVITSCGSKSNETEVKIGTQIWMTENLNVDHFRNGDQIPEARTDEEWKQAGENHQPAWCYYENRSVQDDTENGNKYGKLYNWYAVNDSRGLAPNGWHIPSDDEWTILTNFLGGEGVACNKMKSKSGWSALAGGVRASDGTFGFIVFSGLWWSATEYSKSNTWFRTLHFFKDIMYRANDSKSSGFSVRCIKD